MKFGNDNEIILEINDPVEYQEFETLSCITIAGHFAGYDDKGYPYVFSDGGTSYTRSPFQVVKCKRAFLLTGRSDAVIKTREYNDILNDNRANINTRSNSQGSFIIGHDSDLNAYIPQEER